MILIIDKKKAKEIQDTSLGIADEIKEKLDKLQEIADELNENMQKLRDESEKRLKAETEVLKKKIKEIEDNQETEHDRMY